jgi:hypothetical protein
MPYAILVSALGAIISTSIALFAMHSLSATKIAPVVGAILGLIFGIATLRLRGLPLRATLEEYRISGEGESGSLIISEYLKIALGTALLVSIVEVPVVLIGGFSAPSVFAAGLIAIVGYTFYRAWRSSDRLLNIDFDAFNLAGGAATLILSGFVLYGAFGGWQSLVLNASGPDLIKGVWACNAFGAFAASMIAFFGLTISHRVREMISSQRH